MIHSCRQSVCLVGVIIAFIRIDQSLKQVLAKNQEIISNYYTTLLYSQLNCNLRWNSVKQRRIISVKTSNVKLTLDLFIRDTSIWLHVRAKIWIDVHADVEDRNLTTHKFTKKPTCLGNMRLESNASQRQIKTRHHYVVFVYRKRLLFCRVWTLPYISHTPWAVIHVHDRGC